jgi:putative DNA primase/helicase
MALNKTFNADDIFGSETPSENESITKNDTQIISNSSKNVALLSIDKILNAMIERVPNNISLVKVLTDDIKDKLVKYKEDGEVIVTKIPDNLYIVAIIHKFILIAKEQGWDIAREDGFIYLFNGKYWVQCQKDDLYKFFKSITKKMKFYSPAKAETKKFKDDMYGQFLASAEFYSPLLKSGTVLLNCQNGTLEVTEKTVKLRDHKKEDFLKYVLPFEYNKEAKAPIFERYLSDVLSTDTQGVLQEFCGYIFVSNLKLEKCLVCYGSGANGKSVFFEVITSLLGKDNIATKSLGDLTDNNQGSYNRAVIKDALVNYGSEIKGKNIDVDIFKRLVSGEPVQARLPYGQPFDLINNAKFMFNANELPKVDEHNEAVFRRFIIIPFSKTIQKEKRDAELHSKIIKSELSGVLNWVLIGLEKLLQNKKFSEVQEIEDALKQYKKESDSVALFVEENEHVVSFDYQNFKPTQELYDNYKEETKNNGSYPLSKSNFSKRLRDLGFKDHRSGAQRGFLIDKKKF